MSVKQRTDDALLLYRSDRHEGALLSTLIAIAATARKRRDRSACGDKESFTKFVGEEMLVITRGAARNFNVRFRAERMPLQQFFYVFLRCELVHEGRLPDDVRFISPDDAGGIRISVSEKSIELSRNWLDGLYNAVRFAPENSDEFPEDPELPDDVLKWFMFGRSRENPEVQSYWTERQQFVTEWAARGGAAEP